MDIQNTCQRIGIIEALMCATGMAKRQFNPVSVKEYLFEEQSKFESPIFHHDYKVAVDRKFGIFAEYILITFRYDMLKNEAKLIISGNNTDRLEKIKAMINEQMKVLEASDRQDREELKELAKPVFDDGLKILQIEPDFDGHKTTVVG